MPECVSNLLERNFRERVGKYGCAALFFLNVLFELRLKTCEITIRKVVCLLTESEWLFNSF